MNKIKFILFIAAIVSISVSSCKKDISTADISRVTHFAEFSFEGSKVMISPCGTTFTDPGVSAVENGNNVDVAVSVSNGLYFGSTGVDENVADVYDITYSAVNSDGFEGSESRRVIVACNGDMVSNIEGLYTSTVTRISGEVHSDLEYIIIRKTGENEYGLSHSIGGFYELGRGYGAGYGAYGATVSYNGTSYSVSDSAIPGFGLAINVTEFTVDATTKTITYHGNGAFGSGDFDVVLTQVPL